MTPSKPSCLACKRSSDDVPLIPFSYRNGDYHICSQHLPFLIHDPTKLAGVLPGAEGMSPAEHED